MTGLGHRISVFAVAMLLAASALLLPVPSGGLTAFAAGDSCSSDGCCCCQGAHEQSSEDAIDVPGCACGPTPWDQLPVQEPLARLDVNKPQQQFLGVAFPGHPVRDTVFVSVDSAPAILTKHLLPTPVSLHLRINC